MDAFTNAGQHQSLQQTLSLNGQSASAGLVAISLSIQVADVLATPLLSRKGFFRIGVGLAPRAWQSLP